MKKLLKRLIILLLAIPMVFVWFTLLVIILITTWIPYGAKITNWYADSTVELCETFFNNVI